MGEGSEGAKRAAAAVVAVAVVVVVVAAVAVAVNLVVVCLNVEQRVKCKTLCLVNRVLAYVA